MCLVITCEQAGEAVHLPSCPQIPVHLQQGYAHRTVVDLPARYAAQRMAEQLESTLILNEFSSDLPYRERIRLAIERTLSERGFAIHLSVRSFNLQNRGKIRRTDVGLLYDPSRQDEVDLCLDWMEAMWDEVPMLKVRRNYPRQ